MNRHQLDIETDLVNAIEERDQLQQELGAAQEKLARLLGSNQCEGEFCGRCYRQGIEDAAEAVMDKAEQWEKNPNLRQGHLPVAARILSIMVDNLGKP